jgi:hypothetical protein
MDRSRGTGSGGLLSVLYEALAGSPPFDSETMPELCARIMTEPPPPLRQFRPDLPAADRRDGRAIPHQGRGDRPYKRRVRGRATQCS